ncbi:MAG: hypothetical protein L0K65_00995, partial [Actinomyces sp.]|nr:hypothetical protein [Actinomyces sp.]
MFGRVEVVGQVAAETALVGVPVATESVPAGWPSPAADYFDGDVDLNEHLLVNRPASFIVRVAGDSMIGVGIFDGDELVVDPAQGPVAGAVVIAVVDAGRPVK